MATLFADTFDRADSDTVGGNWVETIGDWDIVSNGVRAVGGTTDSLLMNTTALGTADYKVTASIRAASMWGGAGAHGIGVAARWVDVHAFYLAWCDSFDDSIRLYRGDFVQLGVSYSPIPVPSDPFTLAIACNGSNVWVELNGVQIPALNVVDTTHTAVGNIGLRTWNAADFSDHLINSIQVDDFLVTTMRRTGGLGGMADIVADPLRRAGSVGGMAEILADPQRRTASLGAMVDLVALDNTRWVPALGAMVDLVIPEPIPPGRRPVHWDDASEAFSFDTGPLLRWDSSGRVIRPVGG